MYFVETMIRKFGNTRFDGSKVRFFFGGYPYKLRGVAETCVEYDRSYRLTQKENKLRIIGLKVKRSLVGGVKIDFSITSMSQP